MNIEKFICRSNQKEWQPLIENEFHYEGIWVKSLYFDTKTNRSKAILLKFEAGTSYPFHIHPAGEEILVLEGSCIIQNATLNTGDYLFTPPQGKHGVTSKTGCTLFLSIPEEVILIPEEKEK
ncbi:ChrR-like protein with cupin domain [Flavobacterium sp. 9AF]|uniref:cupin domain-containing protein n=1 Tax=Flavobacterium sp. 9AF TaxID=2653142 RepID=UPI0012F19B90|nr:cupin domain-containing protein [Flavobacterium sp. 9AF]VXB69799.1 ChrR-like protein with cupin domain [Flavobacterium sp. 9AF]